jgi:DNA-binding transcriptional LysR family regulator
MPRRFTLRQLEYVVAVGEAGSVLAAAARLNVSSSSISASITQLEAELGLQLFVRQHAHGLYLTAGGQRIFNEAKHILHSVASLGDLANDLVEIPRGPIVVGCLVTLAPLISAAIRRGFAAEFPGAEISMREGNQSELLAMLNRAEIDIAITYDLDIPPGFDFEGLVALPPQVIVAPRHPLLDKDEITIQDLAGEPFVLLDLPLSREYFLSLFHEAGVLPQIAERAANLPSLRSLVANGFGFGLLNIRTRTNLAPDGEPLVFRTLAGTHRPMVCGLARVKSDYSTRIVSAFADHVRERVAKSGLPGMS